jgi:predicted dehydrogenase
MSKHSKVTRYALVGTGARAFMFSEALLKIYKGSSSLVAICDVNQQRMDFHNEEYARKYGAQPVPTWLARDFDRMIA